MSVTLATLRQRFQTLYDVSGSAVLTSTDGGEVDQLLNDGYRALWNEIAAVNKDFRVTPLPFTISTGQTTSLPSDFREVRTVRRDPGTAQQAYLSMYGPRSAGQMEDRSYRLSGSLLYIEPLLRAPGSYSLDYGPQCPALTTGASTLDVELEQFQDFIVYDAVIAALAREESDISQMLVIMNGDGRSAPGIRGRVHRWASDQRSADASMVEDVRGGSTWEMGAAVKNLRKPDRGTVAAPEQLLTVLVGYYDALVELRKDLLPSRVPALKSVTRSLYADLRAAQGDVMGELGPRLTMISGGTTILDGGQGVFVWDPASTIADDGVNTFQVAGLNPGRWRRTAM